MKSKEDHAPSCCVSTTNPRPPMLRDGIENMMTKTLGLCHLCENAI